MGMQPTTWCLFLLSYTNAVSLSLTLLECERERASCELAMERVPPREFRRIADELAECQQHLEQALQLSSSPPMTRP